MGCLQSNPIDVKLDRERILDAQAIKILLLGTGESGKSTLFKQMKILHLSGFSDEEKSAYKPLILDNTLDSILSLCQIVVDLDIPFSDPTKSVCFHVNFRLM